MECGKSGCVQYQDDSIFIHIPNRIIVYQFGEARANTYHACLRQVNSPVREMARRSQKSGTNLVFHLLQLFSCFVNK